MADPEEGVGREADEGRIRRRPDRQLLFFHLANAGWVKERAML